MSPAAALYALFGPAVLVAALLFWRALPGRPGLALAALALALPLSGLPLLSAALGPSPPPAGAGWMLYPPAEASRAAASLGLPLLGAALGLLPFAAGLALLGRHAGRPLAGGLGGAGLVALGLAGTAAIALRPGTGPLEMALWTSLLTFAATNLLGFAALFARPPHHPAWAYPLAAAFAVTLLTLPVLAGLATPEATAETTAETTPETTAARGFLLVTYGQWDATAALVFPLFFALFAPIAQPLWLRLHAAGLAVALVLTALPQRLLALKGLPPNREAAEWIMTKAALAGSLGALAFFTLAVAGLAAAVALGLAALLRRRRAAIPRP